MDSLLTRVIPVMIPRSREEFVLKVLLNMLLGTEMVRPKASSAGTSAGTASSAGASGSGSAGMAGAGTLITTGSSSRSWLLSETGRRPTPAG